MRYNAFGVSNHLTFKSVGGHYTSYVGIQKKEETNLSASSVQKENWFEFDDDEVKPMSSECVVTKNAFLVFYKRHEFKASTFANLINEKF